MEELRLQEELRKTRQELLLLYEIGNLIRTTLYLDEVVYLILSAVTSHEGMGFNRALLFLVDETGTFIEGRMGIGPKHPEASPVVWKMIEENRITLEGLLDVYHKAQKNIDPELNEVVRQVRLPIEQSYGVLPQTVIQDKGLLVSAEDAHHALGDRRLAALGIGQFACVPLRGKNRVIGALMVDNVSTKKRMAEYDVRRLTMLADHAGLALENAQVFGELEVTSHQDSLTKLWNHGHFQTLLDDSLKDAKVHGRPLGLFLFDVDDFKSYNDSFGHQDGDLALEYVARTAKGLMRRMDYVARYGGEEFVAVLPNTTKEEALKLADRLKSTIGREPFAGSGLKRKITVSVGVAGYPEDAEDKPKLIACADKALYNAKRGGKNRVTAFASL
ncbi:MAG: hypothetical protein A3D28_00875 [Omnitrophica bacterium RIFCSPHIGHO2_02_FULL_63_14]|nr:MAG: hypothetical protein A3D28_00875 [Omnitrophica bacterium RIFCSPHIGHO2_02_FULL_63_14]